MTVPTRVIPKAAADGAGASWPGHRSSPDGVINLTPIPIIGPVWNVKGDWVAVLARTPEARLPEFPASPAIPWLACESRFVEREELVVALPSLPSTARGAPPALILPWDLAAPSVGLPVWRMGADDRSHVEGAAASETAGLTGLFWRLPGAKAGVQHHRLPLLAILDLLAKDCPDRELTEAVREAPQVLMALLKLVRSVGMIQGVKVSSVKDCLVVLGRKQLYRWVMLMLFSANPSEKQLLHPQMLMVLYRARLMEVLCQLAGGSVRALSEEAFVAGVVSMLPVVLHQTPAQVLAQIATGDATRELVGEGKGPLKPVFALVTSLEESNFVQAHAWTEALGVEPEVILKGQFEVVNWLTELRDGLYK